MGSNGDFCPWKVGIGLFPPSNSGTLTLVSDGVLND